MARKEIRVCDVCEQPIADGARRFSLQGQLTVTNGRERATLLNADDICSEQCAIRRLKDRIDSVVNAITPLSVSPAS